MRSKLALAALAFLSLCLCGGAEAAVAHDATGTGVCVSGTSPVSCTTLTVGSISNGALVVIIDYAAAAAQTAITATWNGTSMTRIGGQFSVAHDNGTEMFCLVAPTAGAQTLTVTMTATSLSEIHVIGTSFSGADQTTPCKNFTSATDQTATTGSLTVTSTTGDQTVAVQSQGDDAISSVNNTQIVIDNSGPLISISGNYASGSSTVAMTATAGSSVPWQMSGLDVAAASGGGAVFHSRLLRDVGQ